MAVWAIFFPIFGSASSICDCYFSTKYEGGIMRVIGDDEFGTELWFTELGRASLCRVNGFRL